LTGLHILQFQIRLGIIQIGLGLLLGGHISGRFDFRDQLALGHLRIEIRVHVLDLARNLAAHGHIFDGIQRAGGGHDLDDVAAVHGHRLKFRGVHVVVPGVSIPAPRRPQHHEYHHPNNPATALFLSHKYN